MTCCEMKGFLTFLILWIINKEPKTGAEIAKELEKRKKTKPSPGTVYPVLKYLKEKKLVKIDSKKCYTISAKGKKELQTQIKFFLEIFSDINEMKNSCICKL